MNLPPEVVSIGAGTDYVADPDGSVELTSMGSGWVELDVTSMVRDWVAHPSNNYGLVLRGQSATGNVTFGVCSELGSSPCALSQAPILTVWHYPHPPTPEPEP